MDICDILSKYSRGYSSVGRAPALQAGGQEFESLYLHHDVAASLLVCRIFYKKIRLHFIGCRSFVPQNLSGFAGGTLHLAVLFCCCRSFSEKSHACCGYAFVNARMTPSRRYQLFSVTRRHSSLIDQSKLWSIIAPAAQIFI